MSHRTRTFMVVGFRPCVRSFVWFVPSALNWTDKWICTSTHHRSPSLEVLPSKFLAARFDTAGLQERFRAAQTKFMSHKWFLSVTHIDVPCQHECHTYGWVMPHVWMHTCECITSNIWMHTCEWATLHIWKRHGVMSQDWHDSCLTYQCIMSHMYGWVMSHIWMRFVQHMNATSSHVTHRHNSRLMYKYVAYTSLIIRVSFAKRDLQHTPYKILVSRESTDGGDQT